MRTSSTARVLALVTQHYRDSSDFNGIRHSEARELLDLPKNAMLRATRALIGRGAVAAIFGDRHPNPHIRAFADEPIDDQLVKMVAGADPCLYPTEETLKSVTPQELFQARPFTRRLALGEPQLAFAAFDIAVLESYRNDPRYLFQAGDAGGMISIKDEHYESSEMPERDQVLLQSFGFCYNRQKERAVGVFLRYLADLSAEHQQIWQARILRGKHNFHPDYWASSMGHWPQGASIFDVVLAEIRFINAIAKAMGRPPLFKRDFNEERPVEFTFLLRPTRAEFDAFVLTLDKMLSDNLDKEFFKREVAPETRTPQADGSIKVEGRGTIAMLEEWIGDHFRSTDSAVPALFSTLRRVRKLRQYPGHSIRENVFDKTLFETQRELMIEVYKAMQTLRLILGYWPEAKDVETPRILRGETTIWTM